MTLAATFLGGAIAFAGFTADVIQRILPGKQS
jgi:hypothetical protein